MFPLSLDLSVGALFSAFFLNPCMPARLQAADDFPLGLLSRIKIPSEAFSLFKKFFMTREMIFGLI